MVFLHVVVERKAHVLENADVKESLEENLQESHSSVDEDDCGRCEEHKGISREHDRDSEIESQRAGTCVSHENLRRICVVPKIAQQDSRKTECDCRPGSSRLHVRNEQITRDFLMSEYYVKNDSHCDKSEEHEG